MFANLGYLVLVAAAVLGVVVWRVRRPGESFDHAVDRVLNNDEHKQREAERRAGLKELPPG